MSHSDPDATESIAQTLRSVRIITIALALGVAILLAIVALVLPSERPFAPDPWSITAPLPAVGLAYAALALVGSLVVPDLSANARRRALARGEVPRKLKRLGKAERPTDVEALLAIYGTRQLEGVFLLHGAAFFNVGVYNLEDKATTLFAALALLGLLLACFPTRQAVESWLDRQAAQLDQERQPG